MNKRIRAFTIVELLVALCLSGIVISLSYLALQQVTGTIASINHKIMSTAEIEKQLFILYKDFYSADKIYEKDHFIVFTSGSKSVSYQKKEPHLIRKTNFSTDTFKNVVLQLHERGISIDFSTGYVVKLDFLESAQQRNKNLKL